MLTQVDTNNAMPPQVDTNGLGAVVYEGTLPSGKTVTVYEGTARQVIKARDHSGGQAGRMLLALATMLCQIDGQLLNTQEMQDLSRRAYLRLIELLSD